mgnify:CR=1 FL=1
MTFLLMGLSSTERICIRFLEPPAPAPMTKLETANTLAAYLESAASNASGDISPEITLAAEIRREAMTAAYAPPSADPAMDRGTNPLPVKPAAGNEACTTKSA